MEFIAACRFIVRKDRIEVISDFTNEQLGAVKNLDIQCRWIVPHPEDVERDLTPAEVQVVLKPPMELEEAMDLLARIKQLADTIPELQFLRKVRYQRAIIAHPSQSIEALKRLTV